jgi:hypothetical protein
MCKVSARAFNKKEAEEKACEVAIHELRARGPSADDKNHVAHASGENVKHDSESERIRVAEEMRDVSNSPCTKPLTAHRSCNINKDAATEHLLQHEPRCETQNQNQNQNSNNAATVETAVQGLKRETQNQTTGERTDAASGSSTRDPRSTCMYHTNEDAGGAKRCVAAKCVNPGVEYSGEVDAKVGFGGTGNSQTSCSSKSSGDGTNNGGFDASSHQR